MGNFMMVFRQKNSAGGSMGRAIIYTLTILYIRSYIRGRV